MTKKSFKKAQEIFRKHKGILSTAQAIEKGISYPVLDEMTRTGILIRESRGLYRLSDMEPWTYPDLVHIALKVPNSVICLISALAFHNLTTQIPYQVWIALPRDQKTPRLDYPPLNVVHLSDAPYQAGIVEHLLDNVPVHIYDQEKTVTDCFKFRNKIGENIAKEALKDYLRNPGRDLQKLSKYARINRVEKVMRPYIEASL